MSFKNGFLEGSGLYFGGPGLDFEGLGARFWRSRGSILETPDLEFEASRLDCGASCLPLVELPTFNNTTWPMWDRSLARGSFLFCSRLPQRSCQRVGGGGVPPWGPSIRRPPKVCEACWITSPIAFRYARPITARESERPSSLCRPRFLIPSLCLSPAGGGQPESRGKNPSSAYCWASWVDFLPFPSVLQKWLRKNIEKSVKIEDFDLPKPSQNPAKIPSKSISQKTHDFWEYFRQHLSKLKGSKPWKYQFSLRENHYF